MNILDAVIIICIIIGAMGGIRRGFIKEVVYLIGIVLILVLSFYFKDFIATIFYKYLPFFNFKGAFSSAALINILLYERIAFLVVFSILYFILKIILKITGIFEKILKATLILGFFSKIGGMIVGAIEGYVIVFIALFVLTQPFLNIRGFDDSKCANWILDSTPILSEKVKDTRTAVNEIYSLKDKYKNKQEFNNEVMDLFLKYKIISEDNFNLLKEKGKI